MGGYTQFFLNALFGSIFLVARTPPYSSFPSDSNLTYDLPEVAISQPLPPRPDIQDVHAPIAEMQRGLWQSIIPVLISCVPNPGYFVAGGVAGIVSRTATAPLDRLKVYLIAQISVKDEAVSAAKSGNVFRAAFRAFKPLIIATRELWQAGGMRSLYAGKLECISTQI